VSDALAFDVSNSARRRLRIPSVFTISKSSFLAEDPCTRDEGRYRVDPVTFVSALAAKEAPYSPVSPTCQTPFFTFFAFAINEMGEPEAGPAEPLPLPLPAVAEGDWKPRDLRMCRRGIPRSALSLNIG
jgi:hypothetical protein